MKRMRLVADVTFDSVDLDDAFAQWRDHFAFLLDGGDTKTPVKEMLGEIQIAPVASNDAPCEHDNQS